MHGFIEKDSRVLAGAIIVSGEERCRGGGAIANEEIRGTRSMNRLDRAWGLLVKMAEAELAERTRSRFRRPQGGSSMGLEPTDTKVDAVIVAQTLANIQRSLESIVTMLYGLDRPDIAGRIQAAWIIANDTEKRVREL